MYQRIHSKTSHNNYHSREYQSHNKDHQVVPSAKEILKEDQNNNNNKPRQGVGISKAMGEQNQSSYPSKQNYDNNKTNGNPHYSSNQSSPSNNNFNDNHSSRDHKNNQRKIESQGESSAYSSQNHHQKDFNNKDHKTYQFKQGSVTGTESLFNKTNQTAVLNALTIGPKKLLIDTSIEGLTRLIKVYQRGDRYQILNYIEESDNEENIQSNIYLAQVTKIDKANKNTRIATGSRWAP
jgi:hypothetical protein